MDSDRPEGSVEVAPKSPSRRHLIVLGLAAAAVGACGTAMDSNGDAGDSGADAAAGDASETGAFDAGPDGSTREGGTDAGIDATTHEGGADAGTGDASVRDGGVDAIAHDATSDATRADASGTDAATCTPSGTHVGAVSTYPQGTWHKLSSPHVIIAHDSGGLYAYSDICTHQGCIVNAPNSTGLAYCPCHGSEFNGNGGVVRGPATTPLPHFKLMVCSGQVYVNTNVTVSASTRTPP